MRVGINFGGFLACSLLAPYCGLGSGIHIVSVYWTPPTSQLRKFANCIFLFLLFGCLDRCIFSNCFPNFRAFVFI